MNAMLTKFRVELQTNPSPGMEFYRGYVDVFADSDASGDDLFRAAVRQLQRTSFPDRGMSCWRMIGCEKCK